MSRDDTVSKRRKITGKSNDHQGNCAPDRHGVNMLHGEDLLLHLLFSSLMK